jgi:glucan-binding YG repeat protein
MKRYKILLSLVCVVVFIFLAVGSSGDDDEPARAVDVPSEAVEEPEEVAEEQQNNEAFEQVVLKLLQENVGDTTDIEFVKEDETFYLTPTDPAFILDLADLMAGKTQALDDWDYLVDSFKSMSESSQEMLPDYWYSLRNPANPDNLLLIVSNGYVIYNFMDE